MHCPRFGIRHRRRSAEWFRDRTSSIPVRAHSARIAPYRRAGTGSMKIACAPRLFRKPAMGGAPPVTMKPRSQSVSTGRQNKDGNFEEPQLSLIIQLLPIRLCIRARLKASSKTDNLLIFRLQGLPESAGWSGWRHKNAQVSAPSGSVPEVETHGYGPPPLSLRGTSEVSPGGGPPIGRDLPMYLPRLVSPLAVDRVRKRW